MRRQSFLLPALLLLAGSPGHWAAAEQPVASAPALSAARALDHVEASLRRLRAQLPAAGERFDAAPLALTEALARARAEVAGALLLLRGQPWDAVQATLQRATALRRQADEIQRTLEEWPARPTAAPEGGRAVAGTGHITGFVVDARTGAPVAGGDVWFFDQSGSLLDIESADASGAYTSEGLGTGTYFVRADDYDYQGQLYNGIPCEPGCDETTGTPVPVVDGQVTGGINFALLPFSSISGTVLDGASQLPLAGARVTVYAAGGGYAGSDTVASDGTYEVTRLPAGTYFVAVTSDYYLDEVYDDIPCQEPCDPEAVGTPVLVPPASAVTGIDFGLAPGGSISGRVTDAASGSGIDSGVFIFDAAGNFVDDVGTTSSGRFQAFDLPTGTYFARTSSGTHADQLYAGIPCEPTCTVTQGTPIAVTAGQEHAGVDFALTVLGGVSGLVTDAASGVPLAGVEVALVNGQGGWQGSVYTDVSGRYVRGGLAGGNYFAYTLSSQYVDELYDNLPCDPTCTPTFGTPIPVAIGAETTGVNFALDRGGRITGRVVRQATGQPLAFASVTVYRASNGQAASTYTGSQGAFIVDGLPGGTYFAVAAQSDYVAEVYREMPCTSSCNPTSGTPIPVAVGQTAGGVDFTLNALGQIEGRVTEALNGLPISTQVQVYTQGGALVDTGYSGPTGWYTVTGLPSGTYFVRTNSYDDTLVDELYDNRTCEPSCAVTTGTPVTAVLDGTTSGIDFALRRTRFIDVPVTHWAWSAVEAISAAGITSGCSGAPPRFCPDANVNRAQMAVFLLRAKDGPAYVPPPAQGLFEDVPASDPFARWIEELAHRAIATGCSTSPPRFCPANPTTRAQMAPLLLVTREGAGYLPPPAVGLFQDLPASDPFARWAEELVRRHVTSGCSGNPPLYCPGQPTTRAQMAVFLKATFGLPTP